MVILSHVVSEPPEDNFYSEDTPLYLQREALTIAVAQYPNTILIPQQLSRHTRSTVELTLVAMDHQFGQWLFS